MSDLLNSASLVMIPSGYKATKIYSEIPTDGSGDLSFTRSSNGTRINSAGLVEVCPWNLVQQSETFDNATWTKDGLTVTTNTTVAPNGTTTADTFTEGSASGQHRIYQVSAQSTNIYTISVYVKNITGTRQAYIDLGPVTGFFNFASETTYSASGIASFENVGNGWYRFSLTTATAITPSTIYMGLGQGNSETYTGNGTSAIAFWGAQLNIGSTAKPYFPTTDRLNVPRLTYQNGGGGCPSLLLEKQSTNLMLWSEDLAQTSWLVAQLSVTANATTSPDGTQNADKIAINNGLVGGYIYQSQSTTSSTIYTGSFFVKSAGIGFTKFWSSVSGSYCNAIINLSTGVITNGASPFPTIPTATNFGNGWWRVSYTETSGGGSVPIYVDGGSTSNGGDITGNGTDGIYLWGAQLEASSYPTSYIPTTSASATRVADVCTKTGIGALIGGTSGTVFFDIKTNPTLSSANYKQFCYYLNAAAAQSYMFLDSANQLQTNSNWGSFVFSATPFVANTRYKVALVYAPNDFALYVNGVSVATASSGTPNNNVSIQIGQLNGSENCEFVFNQYTHFPSRLTNAELVSLTTI